ncbi:hypothetical protein MBLNU459_g1464t1 [Dothideomycetes sp. NU459]
MPSIKYFAAVLALISNGVIAQSNSVPVTGLLGNATLATNNPVGAVYAATLLNSVSTAVRGEAVAKTVPNGVGVSIQVSLSGFPATGGPFLYHIHDNPISSDGNCSSAGGHVDPFERGEAPSCDASLPMTCQVGDLSGKHGSINDTEFSANYVDQYLSTTPGNGAFLGNRSLVVHFANKTIITCGNFTLLSQDSTTNTSSSSVSSSGSVSVTGTATSTSGSHSSSATKGSTSTTSASSAATATGGAAALTVNAGVFVVGVLAMML